MLFNLQDAFSQDVLNLFYGNSDKKILLPESFLIVNLLWNLDIAAVAFSSSNTIPGRSGWCHYWTAMDKACITNYWSCMICSQLSKPYVKIYAWIHIWMHICMDATVHFLYVSLGLWVLNKKQKMKEQLDMHWEMSFHMTHLLGWYKEARVIFHIYEQHQANWHVPANKDI